MDNWNTALIPKYSNDEMFEHLDESYHLSDKQEVDCRNTHFDMGKTTQEPSSECGVPAIGGFSFLIFHSAFNNPHSAIESIPHSAFSFPQSVQA